MSTPISFTIRPPPASTVPSRPSPLGGGGATVRAGNWRAPSQRMFGGDNHDDDDDDVGGSRQRRDRRPKERDERIDGIGNGRVISREKSPELLVIAPQPNKNWRDSARRTAGYRPQPTSSGDPSDTHERTGHEPQRSGLRFAVKAENVDGVATSTTIKTEMDVKPEIGSNAPPVKTEFLSLEEQALQAVLAGEMETIDSTANERIILSERDALKRDIDALPEDSTLEDYAAVPVEAFGAAMLRGMGFDPSQDTPIHVPKARPMLLGIGATSLSAELPAPSRKDPKKRREAYANRGGRGYNASNLVVRRGDDRDESGNSGTNTPAGFSSRRTSPGTDSGRDSDRKRRVDYETDEERSRRKARERERERERYGSGSGREDRDRDRDRDRDYRDHRKDRDRDYRDRRDDRRDRDRERERR